MTSYVALIRGINVGGNNLVKMPALVKIFEDAGYGDVRTHLQSGNVLFTTDRKPATLETAVEKLLERELGIPLLVVVRSRTQLATTIAKAPKDHGSAKLRSDVIFIKGPLTPAKALAEIPELREGVDSIAAGPGALYFSRVAANATKTRIQKLLAMPMFKQMTIRSWKTTTRILEMLDA